MGGIEKEKRLNPRIAKEKTKQRKTMSEHYFAIATISSAIETMESSDLHNKIAMMKQSFFDEGFLLPTQFQQLELLQDEENPDFVQEIFDLYFRDTTRQFAEIEEILHQEPAGKQSESMNRFLHRLKGSVISLGALKTLNEVNKMRQFLEEGNMEGTIAAFEQVKVENENLRVKVEPYFQLLGQVESSGTAGKPQAPK